jgi:hypothetical protein
MKIDCHPAGPGRIAAALLSALLASCQAPPSLPAKAPAAPQASHLPGAQALRIDEVWGGTGVEYDAVSTGKTVYIAYFDAQRRFTVARVDTATGAVAKKTLNSVFGGFDVHNFVTLAYDRQGYLHVSGNMHGAPLVYGRTQKPGDFDSLELTNRMVGSDEAAVTYPYFFFLANGDLLFSYRSGHSGEGTELINRFDGQRWTRLLQQPLFAPASASDPVNAYHSDYSLGPDGYYHVAWVWRRPNGAELNFNVCYARSKDFTHWEDSRGRALALPLTPANAETVDAVPVKGGLFNNVKLGYDPHGKPVISYQKYDRDGNSQLYHARPNANGWQVAQSTDWKYRWAFSGNGALATEIASTGVRVEGGRMLENVSHKAYGNLQLELDPATLLAKAVPATPAHSASQNKLAALPQAAPPYKWRRIDIKPMAPGSVRGQIAWQFIGVPNNDKPRDCASVGLPANCPMTSTLELVLD